MIIKWLKKKWRESKVKRYKYDAGIMHRRSFIGALGAFALTPITQFVKPITPPIPSDYAKFIFPIARKRWPPHVWAEPILKGIDYQSVGKKPFMIENLDDIPDEKAN